MTGKAYLLIARKDGSSSSRRQRAFELRTDVDRAIDRWRAEGFNTWWLFGARAPGSPRPLLKEWQERVAPAVDREEPHHPRTHEPTNAARAERVHGALLAYAHRHYALAADQKDHETVAQDFLTDLFHWMHQHGLAPSDIAQRAADMVQTEIGQEG